MTQNSPVAELKACVISVGEVAIPGPFVLRMRQLKLAIGASRRHSTHHPSDETSPMKSIPRSLRPDRRLIRALAALSVLSVGGVPARAQAEAKIPRPLPHMVDVKTADPAPLIPAQAGPERIVPEEMRHVLPKPPKTQAVPAPGAAAASR